MKMLIIMTAGMLMITGCQTLNKWAYEDKCKTGNWAALGEADGATGRDQLSSWGERCSQFGTTPNAADYNRGFAQGKVNQCGTLGNASGAKGEKLSYPATCTTTSERNKFRSEFSAALGTFCSPEKGVDDGTYGRVMNTSCATNKAYKAAYSRGTRKYCVASNFNYLGSTNNPINIKACPSSSRYRLQKAYDNGKKLNGLKTKIASLEAEVQTLEPKVYDTNIPADARVHYKEILATKRQQIKDLERQIYSLTK